MEVQASAPLVEVEPPTNLRMLEGILSLFIETIFPPPHTPHIQNMVDRIRTDRHTFNWASIWREVGLAQRFEMFLKPIETDLLYSYRSRDPRNGRELRPDHTLLSSDLTQAEVEACLAQNEAIAPYLYVSFHLLRSHPINPLYRDISIQWNGAFIALIPNPAWDRQSRLSTAFEVWYVKNAVVDGIMLFLYAPRSDERRHPWLERFDIVELTVAFAIVVTGLVAYMAWRRS
jgi:hypothetical protein